MIDEKIKQTIFNDIYKVINEIKKCHSKSSYNILKMDLDIVYEDEEYNLLISRNTESYNSYKYLDQMNFSYLYKIDYKENTELVYDFFSQYNKKLYDVLAKGVKNNRIFHKNHDKTEFGGITYCSFNTFEPYILINRNNIINDSISLAHECAHYYIWKQDQTKSSKVKINKQLSYFDEVYSHYISFIYANYLIENHKYVRDVCSVFNSINYVLYNSLNDIQKIYDGKCRNINEIQQIINYSYGILIAYHYYDMYLKDKELADYSINQFIKDEGLISPIEILEKNKLKEELIESKILKKYI